MDLSPETSEVKGPCYLLSSFAFQSLHYFHERSNDNFCLIENFVCCPVCFFFLFNFLKINTYFSFLSVSLSAVVVKMLMSNRMVKILKSDIFPESLLSRKNPEETPGFLFRQFCHFLSSGLVTAY